MSYREKFSGYSLLDTLRGGEQIYIDRQAIAEALHALSPTHFPNDELSLALQDIEKQRHPLESVIWRALCDLEPDPSASTIAHAIRETFLHIESEVPIDHAIKEALEKHAPDQSIVPIISRTLREVAPNWKRHFLSELDDSSDINRDKKSVNLRVLVTSLEESAERLVRWVHDRRESSKSSSRQKVENLINALGALGHAISELQQDSLARHFVEQALLANELDLIEDELQERFENQEGPAISPSDLVRAELAAWRTLDTISGQAHDLGILIAREDVAPLTQTGRKQKVAEISYIQSLVFHIRYFCGEEIKTGSSPTSRFNAFAQTMLQLAGVHLSAEEIRNKIKTAKNRKKG